MRKVKAGLASLALVAAGGAGAVIPSTSATASPPVAPGSAAHAHGKGDELPNPREEKRRELREAALAKVLEGKARVVKRGASSVVRLGAPTSRGARGLTAHRDQYVELGREKTDKIFVILAEFGNERHPDYPDKDTDPKTPGPARFDGPLHNEIPAPDRSVDNSTVWQADYSADYFRKLYFGKGAGVESVKTYFERQSSGRYSVDGLVTDWVKVRYNEARYGRSNGFPCAGNVCSNTWHLIRDAVAAWVDQQKAAGKSDAQIAADLKSYDQWDRYDHDGDGEFNEADGYIDHFQIVHAGGDQADGDPHQGEDAIWSHRWKAFQNTGQGPAGNKDGGTQIGSTGLWIADYTMQPENGGLSVFAHEYGHDLGLPDLYDTQGGGGDSAVGHWSLMAQSRLSAKGDQGIGTRPGDLDPWSKIQLGWFDYETVVPADRRTLELGPHEYNSAKPQGVVVVLPDKPVVTQLGAPRSGQHQYWSGQGDDRNGFMSRQVTLPAGTASLSFQARWNIEDCGPDACDYAYVEVDDGSGWKAVPGSITKAAEGHGIDGLQEAWTPATFDLSAFAGRTVGLRIRYVTDGAAQGADSTKPSGIFVDDVVITAGGQQVLRDDAEAATAGWTMKDFSRVGASFTTMYDHFYIASHRAYVSYDKYLRTGPYNFGFAPARPRWVEHYPYQDGLLVWYWDTSQSNNDVGVHPGQGEILPVDAHPRPMYNLEGQPWRGRIALYDAPFGLQKADSFTLHVNGKPSYVRGQEAVSLFDDRGAYWDPKTPLTGVKLPKTGVRIRVLAQNGTSMTVRVSQGS